MTTSHTDTKTTLQRALMVFAAIAAAPALHMAPAIAAGGNGSSFCSNAGAPTGSNTPWIDGGNPGETASWLAQNVGFNDTHNPGHILGPGSLPINAGVCNPLTSPQS